MRRITVRKDVWMKAALVERPCPEVGSYEIRDAEIGVVYIVPADELPAGCAYTDHSGIRVPAGEYTVGGEFAAALTAHLAAAHLNDIVDRIESAIRMAAGDTDLGDIW